MNSNKNKLNSKIYWQISFMPNAAIGLKLNLKIPL